MASYVAILLRIIRFESVEPVRIHVEIGASISQESRLLGLLTGENGTETGTGGI